MNGALFVILLAVCVGIVSGGKKLYEILFFIITYLLVEKGPIVDYIGAVPHDNHLFYVIVMLGLNMFF